MRTKPSPVTDAEWLLLRRLVEDRSGIQLPPARRIHLDLAVSKQLESGNFGTAAALYQHLSSESGHTDLESFVASLTVGETHFFRNKPQIEALEQHVLPDLIRRRSTEKRLRIWSAGCSTGEEPYSLAMLLDRLLVRRDDWNITILATDIDQDALKKARLGMYRPWSFRGVPPELWSRYFLPHGDEVELVPEMRDMVTFEYLNLVQDVYPSLSTNTNAMDLIVCRNVLIYFREETARSVIGRLERSMVEDAWMFLGHAEPSHWVGKGLRVYTFQGAMAYRRPATEAATEPYRIAPPPRVVTRERRAAPQLSGERRKAPVRKPRPPSPEETSAPPDLCDAALAMLDSGDARGSLAQLAALEKRYRLDPRPPYLIAKIYAGALDVEQAEMWSRIALERDRLFAPAHHLQGLVAAEDGRLEDALAAMRRCVYAAPGWALGYFALAEMLLRTKQLSKARAAFRNIDRLLAEVPSDEEVEEGEGLTTGRLRELVEMQKQIFGLEEAGERRP